ncbi:protein-PII uridylyltransferase [Halarcobacter ebronensis]|uniref:Bifunctional uridylyltransferase/uridylyl-removing enzyme n=1 Tax=Halarcobacter ebronensis TaxID=1462615 RepID=A0A4Q0YB19_9BACT|nr:HD domain-containing protein [Halarcobacter ebronensis]RXJ67115.1 protein-PII uridylyltransferase [Halarcobacter ebronensis]
MTELNIQIEELISQNAKDFEISKVFRTYYKNYVASIDTAIESLGKDFFVRHTKHTDKFIIQLYKYMLRKYFGDYQPMSSSLPVTLIALGSYGREQLCVHSDVDLMILYQDIKGYNLRPIMEELVTLAWDCGLKLGSRVHEIKEIEEAVKEDITIKTSIIESRMIYGSKHLWYSYENVLRKIRKTGRKEFVLEKLEEHKQRLLKYPLKMEPNIKDGYGGMREANMVFWMATVVFGVTSTRQLIDKEFDEEEYKKYRASLEFIFQVRSVLHSVAKKKLDVVNFDLLPELSSKLGFEGTPRMTKERLCMAKILESLHRVHFFSSVMVKKFTRRVIFDKTSLLNLKEYRYKKDLYIIDNKLYTSFNAKPKTLIDFLKELIELPDSVKYFDRSYVYYASKTTLPNKQTKELKKVIKTLLYKPNLYPLIKLLYNGRLFQAVLPITKKIVNQPQFDGYHQHPVDIHSIKALKKLEEISDPYVQELYDSLDEKEKALVRLVTLFHDVGKGRVIDHHISGEKLFKNMTTAFDFEPEQIQLGALLVRYHNMMSKVATSEDIYSEKVILSFTALLKSKLALTMLFVVTYADISAVGETVYNSSNASLLKQLYLQSLPAFDNVSLLNENARRNAKQERIKTLPEYKELSNIMKKKIFYIASNHMFLKLKANEIVNIAVKAQDVTTFDYEIINDNNLIIRIIRKVPLNLGYLLGKMEFLNISTMNIFKLYDEKKFFEINFSEKVDDEDLTYISQIIESSFDMEKKTKLLTPIINREGITIDCNHTTYLASMQVVAKDQKGLLAFIAKIFDDYEVEIETAKLSSIKNKAHDLFLIEKNGNFCAKQEEIINDLCVDEG